MRLEAVLAGLWLALWTPLTAGAQVVERYLETVDVDQHGDATVAVTLDVAAEPRRMAVRIPAAGQHLSDLTATGAAVTATVTGDGAWIVVESEREGTGPTTVGLQYRTAGLVDFAGPTLAHGNRRWSYRFANTHTAVMRRVERTVVLPSGQIVSNVNDVVPAAGDTAVTMPYTLEVLGDRAAVTLRVADLRVGGALGASLLFKPRASRLPLLLGLALASLGYLYAFRDLVRAPRGARTPV